MATTIVETSKNKVVIKNYMPSVVISNQERGVQKGSRNMTQGILANIRNAKLCCRKI